LKYLKQRITKLSNEIESDPSNSSEDKYDENEVKEVKIERNKIKSRWNSSTNQMDVFIFVNHLKMHDSQEVKFLELYY